MGVVLALPSLTDILAPPAEELDVGLGDRLAGIRVGDVVPRLLVQGFLDDGGVGDPHDDARQVSSRHFGCHEVGSCLLKRSGDRDAFVEVFGTRFDLEVPCGDLFVDVLLVIALHQAVSDIADLRLLPVSILRIGLDVRLDVRQELLDIDRMGLEVDFFSVSEAELDGGALARGLGHYGFEYAPVIDDLC